MANASHSSLPMPSPRPEWMALGMCGGHTRLFFPPLAERPQARVRREAKARRICESCPVLVDCRWYARLNREYGYWGGENEEERAAAGYSVPSPIGGRARRRPFDASASA